MGRATAVAQIADGANLTIALGDLKISAENVVENEATVTAAAAKSDKLGLGGSIAVNIGETDTDALLGLARSRS